MRTLLLSVSAAFLLALAGCARPAEPVPVAVSGVDAAAEHPAWMDDPVIYELYVRSFTPEGTFRAIIPRLDELKELGASVLWLMPIHPVGEARRKGTLGSPYAIRDYKDVNPRFGTLEDFQALVDAVHARDMRIVIDLVANHTAWDNAWVEAHPEWYTTDSTGALTHPPGTDWTDVADLNYDDPDLRAAMRDAMRFWVEEVGIDGYRCDVAELVPTDFWGDAIAELRAIKPVLMLAEGADPELYDAGFDLTYAWDTYGALKSIWNGAPADTLFAVLEAERARYGDAERMRFTTNHDETAWDATPLDLFGGTEGAQAAAVIAATLPGALLVYNGQEVGDTQQLPLFEKVAIRWDTDPAMRAFYDDLLARRAASAAMRSDTVEPIPHEAEADVVAYYRIAAGDTALVAVNVRDRAVTTTLPRAGSVTLPPFGWRIDTSN
ncbi:MAG: alpha-amylase family glycosyl hydrolase [Rhodothermales bacterium]